MFADRVKGWRKRLRSVLRRSAVERELDAELAFHLRMEEEKNLGQGMNPAAARRAAILALGGIEQTREAVRDVRNWMWVEDLRRDLRQALRSFRRAPGFAAAGILTLALGIGATTAVFSVVHAVLLLPLPYPDPDRLVRFWETNPAQSVERSPVSPGTFSDIRSRSRALESVALFFDRDFLLTFGERPTVVRGASVSPSLFEILGTGPVLGPGFAPEAGVSGGQDGEIVISHSVWQRHFGGAMDVIGRTIRDQDFSPLTVVGVTPAGFDFPNGVDVWFAMHTPASVSAARRQHRYYEAVARLDEVSTVEEARREVAAIAAQLEVEHPASNAGWGVRLERLDESVVGGSRATLLVLLGLVGCLLLIASGNVANLTIARAIARRHEVAVRVALGAGAPRLFRQWASEGILLALLGGGAGLAVAYGCTRALIALAPADIPRLENVSFGGPVLLFAILITCGTAIVTSLAPVTQSGRSGALEALAGGSRRTESGDPRVREWLVSIQVALTVVLLVSAALLLRSFVLLRGVDLGFDRHHVLTVEVRVPIGHFLEETGRPWFRRVEFYDELIADLETLPGVLSVAGVTDVPLASEVVDGSVWRTDAPGAHGRQSPSSADDQWKAAIPVVTPGYFATMGIPVLRGRAFLPSDRFTSEQLSDPSSPRPAGVAIINKAMAQRFFPDEDPLGKTIVLIEDQSFAAHRTIIGVVGDVRTRTIAEPAAPAVYLPFAQHPGRGLSLIVRPRAPAPQVANVVADRLREYPQVAMSEVRPLAGVVGDAVSRPRFNLLLVGSFAILALLLAGTGIAGVVAYIVTRRTNEIAVRMALGASGTDVVRLLMRDGLRPVVFGLVAGGLIAVAVTRALRSLLFGLAPSDLMSFGVAGAALLLVAGVAAMLPARRAARLDPMTAIRAGL